MFFGKEETKKKSNTLLIGDFNNILWRNWHAYSNLSFAGHSTACLFGLVSQLTKHASNFKPSQVIFTNDSPPYLRKEFFLNFKADRKKLEPEMYNEFNKSKSDCIAFLNLLNIPVLSEKGLEADDLIASLVRDYSDQFDSIVILSNDDDLYQLLNYPNVSIQRSKALYSLKEFKEEHQELEVSDYAKLTALSGSHNGVPGLPGIGPVRAKKIIVTGKWEEVYNLNKETLDLFLKLIKIPFTDDFKYLHW
jgi:DNA polymerase-1